MMQQINLYDAFNNCNKEALVKEFADMFCNEMLESARLEEAMSVVERVYERMHNTTIQKQEKPSIVFVCKTYDDNYTDAFCIEQDDYVKWVEEHKNSPAKLALSDDKLNEMETDDIFAAIQETSFPTKYAFELTDWEEILGWDLFVPCIDAYGLPFCLASVMWEMIIFGIDSERMHKVKSKLIERKEKCDEIFEEQKNKGEHIAPEGFISFDDMVKKILGDEYTEDWYPEEEQKQDMKNLAISTYKANREYEQFLLAGCSELHHNGYTGSIEYSPEDRIFYGKILGISSLISYDGDSIKELRKDFISAVDEYLRFCKEIGKEPEKAEGVMRHV